jgi:hypothetical protein
MPSARAAKARATERTRPLAADREPPPSARPGPAAVGQQRGELPGGRGSIRSGTRSTGCCARIPRSRASGSARSCGGSDMTVARRSPTTTCARCARTFWISAPTSARTGRGSCCSSICGSRDGRSRSAIASHASGRCGGHAAPPAAHSRFRRFKRTSPRSHVGCPLRTTSRRPAAPDRRPRRFRIREKQRRRADCSYPCAAVVREPWLSGHQPSRAVRAGRPCQRYRPRLRRPVGGCPAHQAIDASHEGPSCGARLLDVGKAGAGPELALR